MTMGKVVVTSTIFLPGVHSKVLTLCYNEVFLQENIFEELWTASNYFDEKQEMGRCNNYDSYMFPVQQ